MRYNRREKMMFLAVKQNDDFYIGNRIQECGSDQESLCYGLLSGKTAGRSEAEEQVADSKGLGLEGLGTNVSCEG